MIVGHAAIGFLFGSLLGKQCQMRDEESIQLGILGAVISMTPDVDIVMAFIGFFQNVNTVNYINNTPAIFWSFSKLHRTATHSVVFLSILAVIFTIFIIDIRSREFKQINKFLLIIKYLLLTLAILIALNLHFDFKTIEIGLLLIVYFLGVVLLSIFTSKTTIQSKFIILTITFGLVIHPFGDFLQVPLQIYCIHSYKVVILVDLLLVQMKF